MADPYYPRHATLVETCRACGGAPNGCEFCGRHGSVVRSAYDQASGIGAPTDDERQVEKLEAKVRFLNEKLDATHTHRCFKCEQTVTAETSARQAACDRVSALEEALGEILEKQDRTFGADHRYDNNDIAKVKADRDALRTDRYWIGGRARHALGPESGRRWRAEVERDARSDERERVAHVVEALRDTLPNITSAQRNALEVALIAIRSLPESPTVSDTETTAKRPVINLARPGKAGE